MASQHNLTCAASAAFGLLDTPMSFEQMHLETTWDSMRLGCSGRSTHISYPSLPRDLISLTIKPAAPPMISWPGCATIIYFQYMKELEDLALACPPGKLHLLRAFKRDMWEVECYDVSQAKKDWLDVARGGMGAWSTDEIGN